MEHSETWSSWALPTLTHLTASADFNFKPARFLQRGREKLLLVYTLETVTTRQCHSPEEARMSAKDFQTNWLVALLCVCNHLVNKHHEFLLYENEKILCATKSRFYLFVCGFPSLLYLYEQTWEENISNNTADFFPNCLAMCNTVYLTQALGSSKVLEIESELYFCRYFLFLQCRIPEGKTQNYCDLLDDYTPAC